MRKHKKFLVFLALSVALIFATFSRVNAAATITVNSIADNQANDGVCTLREAIVSSNTDTASGAAGGECAAGSGSGDTIEFGISGTGVKTIPITSTLPAITQTVTIDGYTQTGSTENTTSFPSPIDASLKIEVDGSGMGSGTGIDISGDGADNTTIKGVVINDVPYETIYITDSDNVTISGNFIGTDSTGLVDDGGSGHGIRMSGTATGTMIGGSSAADRNIISGNGNAGVLFYGADVSGNSIHGNYIGLGVDGSTGIGNSNCGVCSSSGANTNTIGGDGTGEGNIISANGVGAFNSSGAGGSNIIKGNFIGTDYLGTTAKNNHNFGILIDENDNNTIGGTTVGARNVIAASDGYNLSLTGGSSNNTISGNYVGIGSDGSTALGGAEINLEGASNNNTIGGTTSGARNVISGNNGGGIGIHGSTTNSNTVIGNYIGTNSTGTVDVGNATYGVVLDNSPSNTVGGTTGVTAGGNCTGACNLISGNGNDGIWLYGNSADSNNIKGNYIGTDVSGNIGLGNSNSGIIFNNGPDSNVIGGSTVAERNIISDNDYHGIGMYGSPVALNNVISGNYIGTGADGTTDLGNAWEGVYAGDYVQATLIGGTTSGQANLIKNNGGGVAVVNTNATDNAIIGNSLYRNDNTAIDLQGNGISDPNDAGDTDTGGNDLLNKPEWGLYDDDSGDTEVTYDLDVPAGDYRIETFSDNGKTLVDTQNITHTGSGSESFSNTITGNGYSSLRMTATEIDGGLSSGFGSTSEYSDAYSDGTETITVNSVADDQADDGECTLREAIVAANSDAESGASDGECVAGAGIDTIEFDIAGAGPHTIQPGSTLPTITADNTTIDGYSETGAVENSGDYSACFVGTIMIEIDGTNTTSANGLIIDGNDVTVRGLAINRFDVDGIRIYSVDGAVVAGNILGLDDEGLVDQGNDGGGVGVFATGDAMIGGTTAADRNLISGNEGWGGIGIYSDAGTTTVSGNCIGTDATGDVAVPNNHYGINLYQVEANVVIGGDTTQERNIISGNDEHGISTDESNIGDITGNYIGVDVDGIADLGNGGAGITVDSDSSVSYIGGLTSGERNVISGNGSEGINLATGTGDTRIRGNYIGVDATGTADLGNTTDGIYAGTTNIIIGGTASGARNVISGNDQDGIELNSSATDATIQGNYVGLDATGTSDIGNTNVGIGTSGVDAVIGGTASSAENVVSDNGAGGISVDGDDSTVIGNLVGTSADGLAVMGNTSVGIKSGGDNVIIGGDSATERNVVAGTVVGGNFSGCGIVLLSFGSGGSGGVVQGNYVGTNINGTIGGGFGNGGFGIFTIGDYSNGVIGGTVDGVGNKVVSSGMGGIATTGFAVFGLFPTNISILGNQVYQNTSTGIRLMADTDGDFQPDTAVPFPNDSGDGDSGTNDFLNFPVLNSSSASAGSLDVNFNLDVPNTNVGVTGYRVEFFANDTGDSSGNGEGQIYLGSANVSGDVSSHTETIALDAGVITTGTYDISATVTEIDGSADGFGATSEFSAFLNDQSVVQPSDNDSDGVNDAVENAGPNGGDGNDDGTLDSLQADVSTILDSTGDNYLTLELEDGGTCNQISDFSVSAETDQASADTGYDYPMGLNSFTIPCADSVNGKIYYHAVESLDSFTYRKYGPTTPGDISSDSWYDSGFTYSTATVGSNTVATASFSLTDGALGDDTGNDDSIVDDNGPATAVSISRSSGLSDLLANTGENLQPILMIGTGLIVASAAVLALKKKISRNNKRRK